MLAPSVARPRRLPLVHDGPAPAPRPALRPGPARPRHAIAPRSVRLSLTDRCDFACVYCRPSHDDGYVDGKLVGWVSGVTRL